MSILVFLAAGWRAEPGYIGVGGISVGSTNIADPRPR
jgi:hypothetical protein